jgi:prevent-host-death family protein
MPMTRVNLADAKARLSELVERAATGEPVEILRRGKAVARIVAVDRPRKQVALAMLEAATEGMDEQEEPARSFVRGMRDDARY